MDWILFLYHLLISFVVYECLWHEDFASFIRHEENLFQMRISIMISIYKQSI